MRKYLELIAITYRNTHTYISEVIGANIVFGFRIFFILTLYKYLYQEYWVQNPIFWSYDFEAIAWPLIFSQAVVVARPRTFVKEIQHDLRSGKIGIQLLLPLHYMRLKLVENLSQFLISLGYFLISGILIGWAMIGKLPEFSFGIVETIIVLFVWVFLWLYGYLFVASIGFFVEDVQAIRWIYSKFDMIFGGNILPVVFMPVWLQTVANYTPFTHQWYSAGLLLTHPSIEFFLKILCVQVSWIIGFVILTDILFYLAKNRLTINWG